LIKMIVLLTRRTGTSPRQFRDYYEAHYAPLQAAECLPGAAYYIRNYLDPEAPGAVIGPDAAPPGFDAITEIGFPSQAALDAALAASQAPAMAARLAAHEARFIERGRTSIFIVEECR
jgi:hypothetical protein